MSESMRDKYENPLVERYSSREMSRIWSPQFKFSTWRRLWLALATAEKELGLPITEAQLAELRAHLDDINFAVAEAKERELRHDVMSHIHAYGEQCPGARAIIHLGATSCFVGDNTDLIQLREGLRLIRQRLLLLMRQLRDFAMAQRQCPTLGFTHYQPAQLTTVGKRAALWLQDFWLDAQALEQQLVRLPFRGVKGTTGTQASFLDLFDGDAEKVRQLDRRVSELMGFDRMIPLTGQTYSRKIDSFVLGVLSGLAQSAHKMATDIRLLMNLKEVDEPFGKAQVGSSAMAYKRNPMRSERICSLSRYLLSLPANTANTHAVQWFERTLDDSANRRIVLPEAFLTADVILTLGANVIDGLVVWPKVIRRRIQEELPFMATENILMRCVKAGGDRQDLHEAIRRHSLAAAERVKRDGASNDLIERIRGDARFAAIHQQLDDVLVPERYVGRAPEQVEEFIGEIIDPFLAEREDGSVAAGEVSV